MPQGPPTPQPPRDQEPADQQVASLAPPLHPPPGTTPPNAAAPPSWPNQRPPQPRITFATTVGAALRNYGDGSGRASRSEFWLFTLFYIGSFVAAVCLAGVAETVGLETVSTLFTAVAGIIYLGLLVPFITVGIRRLHDTGHSGAWLLLLPTIGIIVLLSFWTDASQPHPNRYGP